jgi:YVTN family beta-propeller protein
VVGLLFACTINGQWLKTTIPVGDYPCDIAWNSTNNKVYCANVFSDTVTVIDGATNSVIKTIPVGDGPCAFAYNPIQNRVYVANYYGSSISVIRDSMIGIEEEAGYKKQESKNTLTVTPNPCYAATRIRYGLAKPGAVSIKVYNTAGQCVKTLVSAKQNPGIYELNWQGTDNLNRRLSPGIYFLEMEAGDYRSKSRIVLLQD